MQPLTHHVCLTQAFWYVIERWLCEVGYDALPGGRSLFPWRSMAAALHWSANLPAKFGKILLIAMDIAQHVRKQRANKRRSPGGAAAACSKCGRCGARHSLPSAGIQVRMKTHGCCVCTAAWPRRCIRRARAGEVRHILLSATFRPRLPGAGPCAAQHKLL